MKDKIIQIVTPTDENGEYALICLTESGRVYEQISTLRGPMNDQSWKTEWVEVELPESCQVKTSSTTESKK